MDRKVDGSCIFHALSHQLFASSDRDYDVQCMVSFCEI